MLKDKFKEILRETIGDENMELVDHISDRLIDSHSEWLVERLPESVARAYRTFLE